MTYLSTRDSCLSCPSMPENQDSLPNDPSKWTFEEFKTYLLIFASYADLEFSDDEKSAILQSIDHKTFDKVQSYYLKLGEFERLNFILYAKPFFFPTDSKKRALVSLITRQFEVDGVISKLEKGLLDFLIRLL